MVDSILSHLEEDESEHGHHRRHHHSRSGRDDEKGLLYTSRRQRARVEALMREQPAIFGLDSPDTITTGQVLMLTGFFLSLLTWAFAYYMTIFGGATGNTRIKLAQPNCTPGLGAQFVCALFRHRC